MICFFVFLATGCASERFTPPPLKPFKDTDFERPSTAPTTLERYRVINTSPVEIYVVRRAFAGYRPHTTHLPPNTFDDFDVPVRTMEMFDHGTMVYMGLPPECYLSAFRYDENNVRREVALDIQEGEMAFQPAK